MKLVKQQVHISIIIYLLMLLAGCRQSTIEYTRGVGISPGNPAEDFSPILVADNNNYRNIARLL